MKNHLARLNSNWHAFPLIKREIGDLKTIFMKEVLKRMSAVNESHQGFHLGTAIMMIVLFLAFWGVSFYILLNSYA
jgi:hypothetical protein